MTVTEKQIESQILYWLNFQAQTFAFKVNTVGVFDPKRKIFRRNMNPYLIRGTSDILGVHRGRMLAIEVKTPSSYKRFMKSPTEGDELQAAFLAKVRNNGGLSLVACSLAQVMDWLVAAGNL